ncbi:MAG: NADH-quinone oxidoreductase subunit C [Alphaproteobacteria bacterium]|nr:NADH-quinone oxidoreductase subunit C [Alphaproteobacteria bacterium]OJV45554.1 MAG: NADH-quinone oxidoreductase subunit C [Alphaproteobacteria bacterium 43-37]
MPEKLKEYLSEKLASKLQQCIFERGEITLVTLPENLTNVLYFLRDDSACQFQQLMDVCGVDWPARDKRFDVVYHLLSLTRNQRIRVKTEAGEMESVPTATGIYKSAGWWEREVWDMYGISFSGHQDMRRILTDYGFEGFPMRKDFPLTGYYEVRYDSESKKVVYESVNLAQAYRTFDFESPWEGTQILVPTDEKGAG